MAVDPLVELVGYAFPSSWLTDDHHINIGERVAAALRANPDVVLRALGGRTIEHGGDPTMEGWLVWLDHSAVGRDALTDPTDTDRRDPYCVAEWPECVDGGYDPRCCRFPKSCSCSVINIERAPIDSAQIRYDDGEWSREYVPERVAATCVGCRDDNIDEPCMNRDCKCDCHGRSDELWCEVHGAWLIGNPCEQEITEVQ